MSETATWESVLADLEARIDLAEQALDDGVDLDASLLMPWVPPEGLDPLPVELLERATGVLRRQTELEQRLTTITERISHEISTANHGSRRFSAYGETVIPKYFDSAV